MGELKDILGLQFNSSTVYSIVDEIGRGGMGIVYLAERDSEGVIDHVALKAIRIQSPELLAKLKKEANIATGLRHENIVKTYGLEAIPFSQLPPAMLEEMRQLQVGSTRKEIATIAPGQRAAHKGTERRVAMPSAAGDDLKLYLMVMDYIEGSDLGTLHRTHLKRNLLIPCPLAAFIISRVSRALGYAHKFLVHRDISPENVLMNLQGVVKLSDFGIAVTEASKEQVLAGKFLYMSPEQFRREPVDARTDVFSLGLVLYEMLTGLSPHRQPSGQTREQTERQLSLTMARDIPAPHTVRADIPEVLSAICMKMLAKDRDKRYARSDDATTDLEQKYLYAGGFGPTNNSLACYWELFGREFKDPTPDQLKQLNFLKGDDGLYYLQRSVSMSAYTKLGREWISYLTAQSQITPQRAASTQATKPTK